MKNFPISIKVIFLFSFLLNVFSGIAQQPITLQEHNSLLTQALKNKAYGEASRYSFEIGNNYKEAGEYDKASDFYLQSLSYSKKSNKILISYQANKELGYIANKKKDFTTSIDYFQKALKLARELKNTYYISEVLIEIGKGYAYVSKHKKSIEPLEEALSIATEQGNLVTQQECYELLASYYGKLNNTAKSKAYSNLYQHLIETKLKEAQKEQELMKLEQKVKIVDTEKKSTAAKLTQETSKLLQTKDSLQFARTSLQTTEQVLQEEKQLSENQKLEIELLNKDKELAEFKIKEQSDRLEYEAWIRNLTISGIILSIILIVVVVVNNRKHVKAKHKIEEQNKSITSSINYAKRIQEAMLPKPEIQKSLLPESFVLFKPRDSVSGDFYWISEIKNWYSPDVVFAAVDCTGHGVPGAFMSMIGINALNGIIARGIAETNEILEALDQEIRSTLQQENSGNKDGMDLALCIYRKEKNIIEFSGAKNPLIYIQNNELKQVKGDIHSIGGTADKKKIPFKKHQIIIDQPTTIYLFSDGYRDQFGGKENSKFMSKRFSKLLHEIHNLPMKEQMTLLDKTIEDWKNGNRQTDDILVLGIKVDHATIE